MKVNQKQKALLPESKKSPRLFRLKVASLIVVILIAIMAIVDIIFLLYITSHPEPTANLSFINNIITNTSIITTGDTIDTMIANMLRTNPSMYFQQSQFLVRGTGNNFTDGVLKDQVFRKKSSNLLYIFNLKKQDQSISNEHKFAIYAASSFPLPSEEDFNEEIDYYTFQQTDKRYSMMFSLQNQNFLIMNSTSQQIGYLQCKTYILSEKRRLFNFFSILDKNIDNNNPSIILSEINNQYKCFHDVNNKDQLVEKINNVIGYDIISDNVRIDSYEIYYLNNEE